MNVCTRVVTFDMGMHPFQAAFFDLLLGLYFFVISLTPLAKVIAITLSASLLANIMGVLIWHEVISARSVASLILGVVGGFIILRPGILEIESGTTSIFFSSALWGLTMVIIKVLGRTYSNFTTTAYVTIFQTSLHFK